MNLRKAKPQTDQSETERLLAEAKDHLRAVLASRPWSDYEAWQAARRWLGHCDGERK